ncbi:hypothetical protein [Halalkalicoccus ordinarius]
MSDDRTTRISWERLFERGERAATDLATIEREVAARRETSDG